MSRDLKKPPLLIAALFFGLAMTFLTALQGPGSLGLPAARPAPAPPPAPFLSPGISVFFTDRMLEQFSGGPETGLLAAIDAARAELDIAAYDLDLWSLRDALLAAHRRGVKVRMVMEADQAETEEVLALTAAGIPLVQDLPDGLMHDKFVVIDRQAVWTGSMNFTLNGAYRNDNHLLVLNSPVAAAVYREEFEEMFVAGLFGAYSPTGTPRTFELPGPDNRPISVEVLFSPDDGTADRILSLLDTAQQTIQFMAFAFTSDAIGEKLVEKAEQGVLVAGIFDESQLQVSSEYAYLLAAGLDVRVDGSPYKLHHKAIIIDGATVIAGSYNFSLGAETRNDENTVIIHDPAVAEKFLAEWQRLFDSGRSR